MYFIVTLVLNIVSVSLCFLDFVKFPNHSAVSEELPIHAHFFLLKWKQTN